MSRIINLSETFLEAERDNKDMKALSLYRQACMNQRTFLEAITLQNTSPQSPNVFFGRDASALSLNAVSSTNKFNLT